MLPEMIPKTHSLLAHTKGRSSPLTSALKGRSGASHTLLYLCMFSVLCDNLLYAHVEVVSQTPSSGIHTVSDGANKLLSLAK
jgi:hypothetical protein